MTRSLAAGVLGAQRPRFASAPPSETSEAGDEAIAIAETAGLILDDWQKFVLRSALGEDAWGQWSAFEVGLVVPRQNGKGAILEALQLACLFAFEDKLIIYSAHEFKTAQESYRRVLSLIENTDSLRKKVARVVKSTNESGVELRSGARLRFLARSGGSGRGFSGDKIILDEAYNLSASAMAALLPTMAARPNPQLWYASSAGLPESDHLRAVRDRGREGGSNSLAYFEWSAPDGADLDEIGPRIQANPALGIRISTDFIDRERSALGDEEFGRERLGIWDESTGAAVIPPAWWAEGEDAGSQIVGVAVFALDVSPDQSWSAIAAAGRRADGLTHVEVTSTDGVSDCRTGVDWVVPRFEDLNGRWPDLRVTIAKGSAAESLKPALEAAGIPVDVLPNADVAAACGLFYAKVIDRTLKHLGQPQLTAAISAARKHQEDGEGAWKWGRKKSAGNITTLYAASNAVWAADQAANKPLEPSIHFI